MGFIQLDRHFVEWKKGARDEHEVVRLLRGKRGALDWSDLLAQKRVVILAEGGSGKSSELREQNRVLGDAGNPSFYLTVKKVGQRGVESSMTRPQLEKFKLWRASNDAAWFFIDSVDEAKSSGIGLVDALEHLAAAIEGAEHRAHIILSGRHADWEFKKDLESLAELIPVPSALSQPEAINPDELLIDVIRRRPREQLKAKEKHLIVLMSELDPGQVEMFARARQIEDVERFLGGLSDAKLWSFARRPLDLEWLVRYWRSNGSFAKFSSMLELNISERLAEPDPDRAKSIHLDQSLGMRALERIGANLVLGRLQDIEIPDSGNRADPQPSLRLRDALPDMSQSLHSNLINSAVFVPSGVGMVRLHNDNDGVVSGYLAAKWLRRLLEENCPWSAAEALLFATTYGVKVVKPSMLQTAAWLSIWEPRAAEQVATRQPMALLEFGDAASLPLPIRKKVLNSVLEAFATGEEHHYIDPDGLRRFVQPDMEPDIKELFARLGNAPQVRHVLLQMIDQGKLFSCAQIAMDVATDLQSDVASQFLAIKALSQVASAEMKSAYAKFLRAHWESLDTSVVWITFDNLYPQCVAIEDLMPILPKLLAENPEGGTGINFYGPDLTSRISREDEATMLLAALLATLPSDMAVMGHNDIDNISERLSTVIALANKLLDLHLGETPPEMAIDVALRLGTYDWMQGRPEKQERDLSARLRETPERRRATLWRFVETFSLMGHISKDPLSEPWQLNAARFGPGLEIGDAHWLLADARQREAENERLLALRLAMLIWQEAGRPSWLLDLAKDFAGTVPDLNAAIDSWVNPAPPPEQVLRLQETNKRQHEAQLEQQKRNDASWVAFVQKIRSDPNQLNSLRPPDQEGVDARIFHIWEILEALSGNSQSRSLSDVSLLTPLFGADAIPHIKNAFMRYWRLGTPKLRSERSDDLVNTDGAMERIGVACISIEAATNPTWISTLDDEQVELAATYATLELNSFPAWFEQLCSERPKPARSILLRQVARELAFKDMPGHREALERVARSAPPVVAAIADDMLLFLRTIVGANVELLRPALRIAHRGLKDKAPLLVLSLERAKDAQIPAEISAYLGCAFAINGDKATSELLALATNWNAEKKADLASALLPAIMGTSWPTDDGEAKPMSTENLARLIPFAFEWVHPDDDIDRVNGKVYSPGARDHAQDARDRLITRLSERPGAATFKALHDLTNIDYILSAYPAWHLRHMGNNRAALDSESEQWTPSDVKEFEFDFDTVPRNPADLQRVVAHRIEDLQHKLIHGDYSQGIAVARLEHEVDVQRWVANALEARQGRSFTVVREPHVAAEKEPDILLTSKGTNAHLPLEIKVAESWSLKELEEALTIQLQGRYLRDRDARWGILLVVHQAARPRGWEDPDNSIFLTFAEIIRRLQSIAAKISANDSNGPQMQVALIDVSASWSKTKKVMQATRPARE